MQSVHNCYLVSILRATFGITFMFLGYLGFSQSTKDSTFIKPNIIIILTDDMGLTDVSAYGGPYNTPNIDNLASTGRMFMNYYSASPICSPSRVGILTGMEPAEWNFYSYQNTRRSNLEKEQANYLDPSAPSIAKVLKNIGYQTAHFGKWHMGGGRDITEAPKIPSYGFDEYSSTFESPDPDPLLTASNWIWSPEDSIKRWDRTAYFVDKTLDFMKRHKNKPCFINLWPDDVHDPWVPNVAAQSKLPEGASGEPNFQEVLTEYDKQIGRLITGLKELGEYEDTLIIFTSDNGPYPTFNGKRTHNNRGSKWSLYQGGTHVPLIVSWPNHIPANTVDATTVITALDFFPTLSAITGATMPSKYNFDGINQQVALTGNSSSSKRTFFWEYGSHGDKSTYIFPAADNKYHSGKDFEKSKDYSPDLCILKGSWKLLMDFKGDRLELYNIENDPKESLNVASKFPDIVTELKEQLLNWRKNNPVLEYQN